MIERPPLRALVGAALLGLCAYLLLGQGIRPLAWVGWGLAFLLFAGLLALIGRPGGTRASARPGLTIPDEHRLGAERLIGLICRARGLESDEAAALVMAAWQGDPAPLAARRIILAPGANGPRALAILERRFAREVRFADADPWEPDSTSEPYTRGPRATTPPAGDPTIPAGLESLFAGTTTRPRSTSATSSPPSSELAGQTRLDWEGVYEPGDGDPPPGGAPSSDRETTLDDAAAPDAPGSLADFAEDELLPPPAVAAIEGAGPATPLRSDTPLSDIDPYAEEFDDPWSPPQSPRRIDPAPESDDEDPFAALLPDDAIEEGSESLADDPWDDEPPAPRRPNPFAPDEPLADPYGGRAGGAFRAPLREERPKR